MNSCVPIRIERLAGALARFGENTGLEHALLARLPGFRGRIASVDEPLTEFGRSVP